MVPREMRGRLKAGFRHRTCFPLEKHSPLTLLQRELLGRGNDHTCKCVIDSETGRSAAQVERVEILLSRDQRGVTHPFLYRPRIYTLLQVHGDERVPEGM